MKALRSSLSNPSFLRQWLQLLVAVVLVFPLPAARALVVYGSNEPGDTTYTTAPPNGAPWAYVARVSPNAPSAVYLGNGYLLTANHVGVANSGIRINGTDYNRDQTFAPLKLATAAGDVDLQLWKIIGDPGLTALPIVLPVEDQDLNKPSTFIGWGAGKGNSTTSGFGSSTVEGWYWNTQTMVQRWGTNTSASGVSLITPVPGYAYNYEALAFYQNRNAGPSEAAFATGDSGSGVFQQFGTTWKLAGIPVLADDPSNFKNSNTYSCEAVRVSTYSHLLRLENWKSKHLGSSAAPDDDDSDGDGVPALMEYALGLNPAGNSQAGLPVLAIDSGAGTVSLTYTRLMSATDISVAIEESSDLAQWTPAAAALVKLSANQTVWTMKATVPMNGAITKSLRLKITKL